MSPVCTPSRHAGGDAPADARDGLARRGDAFNVGETAHVALDARRRHAAVTAEGPFDVWAAFSRAAGAGQLGVGGGTRGGLELVEEVALAHLRRPDLRGIVLDEET